MDIDGMVIEILASKKYGSIDASVVERICKETAAKFPKAKDALKAAKNELHIIHEAFLYNGCHKKARAFLSQLTSGFSKEQLDDVCIQIMQLHASTKERIEQIREIYSYLSRHITCCSTVMDIGCGFSPFALPLLFEKPGAYIAYDINRETIELLNEFFSITQSTLYEARLLDAASTTPDVSADIVLLFKLLPILQQQKKGRGFSLLAELTFQKMIISFPLKSMTGKGKGMELFYSSLMESNLPPSLRIIDIQSFSNEMFYVVDKIIKRE